ncbi:MAG: PrsW family glutamic-type intramembrane protease [bacterium]|nr:PrsW family glutamic-type intramembrane protease [bacterium]
MNYWPLILGLLPSFAWLIFYLEEDPHPEPREAIFHIFLAGALSTFLVLGLQILFNDWADGIGIFKFSFLSFVALAAIEEFFKFGAARVALIKHRTDFDEPVDAMIYPIIAALGFAAVENVAAAFKSGPILFETTTLRFIGATLVHTLSSGVFGYYWAQSIIHHKRSLLLVGFMAATLLHTVFNFLIMRYEPQLIPTVFLVFAALFILYDFEKLKHIKTT